MKNGLIIEIAVQGFDARKLPPALNLKQTEPVTHYWRIRYIEDGEEADHDTLSETLRGMACIAELAETPVAWRYYETGIEA